MHRPTFLDGIHGGKGKSCGATLWWGSTLRFTELLATAGGFSEYDVQLVSSLRLHHGPSSSGFAISRRPQVQSEKENVPTPQLGKRKPDRREHQKSQFKFGIRSGQTYPKLIAL